MQLYSKSIPARSETLYKNVWQTIRSCIIIIIATNIFFSNGLNVASALDLSAAFEKLGGVELELIKSLGQLVQTFNGKGIEVPPIPIVQNLPKTEYFSSVDMLQKLQHVELGLLRAFRQYIAEREQETESYRRYIEHIKLQHSIAKKDVKSYLGNPAHAFTLIKRLVTDWKELQYYINDSIAQGVLREDIKILKSEHQIPDESEMKGAVKGLIRLQKTYDLDALDLAHGKVNKVQTNSKLTWHDCFEIGTNLFDLQEYPFALTWFETTLRQLKKSQSDKNDANQRRFEIETLEYLALTNNEMGKPDRALQYIDEIIKLETDHHTKAMRTYLMGSPRKIPPGSFLYDQYIWYNNYTRLCQGIQSPQKIFQKLRCKVETRGNPHFILAPLQVEELYEDPDITVYHNVLSDVQIDRIIQEAKGNLFRSGVVDGNSTAVSDVRTSQQAWLGYESSAMKYVKHLVGEITGLDLSNAELMQMANYGIGGVYEPHHDFFGSEHLDIYPGDRIVTNMFYLSDVKQGGYTVFPYINVFSPPVKGSMVSWYNLRKSLDPDYQTLHGGCPVLLGSKRIGNVWIHSGYQEFRRPCDLKNDNSFTY